MKRAWVIAAIFTTIAWVAPARGEATVTQLELPPPPKGWREVRAGTFSPLDPFHAGFGMGSGVGWAREQTATDNGMGRVGPTLHLDFDAEIYDLVTLAASIGTIFLKDNAEVRQRVINQYGKVFDATESLNLTIAGLAAGLRTPDFCLGANPRRRSGWAAMNGFVRFGHAWISGGRSVSNCIDCPLHALSAPDGNFIEPGIALTAKANDGWGGGFVTAYRGYLAGGAVASELRISLMFSYW